LIALTRVGHLHLLPELYGQVLIPPAVRDEALRRGVNLAGPMQDGWLLTQAPVDGTAVARLRGGSLPLDLGESEAIVLAMELGLRLLIDERRGYRVAQERGIVVTGTVGVILEASRIGLIAIEAVELLLRRMVRADFWLSERLIRNAADIAREQR